MERDTANTEKNQSNKSEAEAKAREREKIMFEVFYHFFSSYEDFHKSIRVQLKPGRAEIIKSLISDLLLSLNSDSADTAKPLTYRLLPERFAPRPSEHGAIGTRWDFLTNFSRNIVYFYRFLVSEGYRSFNDEEVDGIFRFLEQVKVPDRIALEIGWALPLINREGTPDTDKTWEIILDQYDVKRSQRDVLTVSETISDWLLFHIGLKQLFPGPQNNSEMRITEAQERVITNYMSLIEKYHQLEQMFGVTIEKDMYRVYSILGNNREKRKKKKDKKREK